MHSISIGDFMRWMLLVCFHWSLWNTRTHRVPVTKIQLLPSQVRRLLLVIFRSGFFSFSLSLSPFQFYGSEFYVMGFQIALSHFPSLFFLFSVDAYRIFWILIAGSFFSLLLFLLAPLLFITMRWLFGFGYYDQSEEKKTYRVTKPENVYCVCVCSNVIL